MWRRSRIDEDILTTRQETGPAGFEPLLVPVMRGGRRVGPPGTIEAARQRLVRDLDRLPGAARDLHVPAAPAVAVSAVLRSLTDDVTAAMRRRIGEATQP